MAEPKEHGVHIPAAGDDEGSSRWLSLIKEAREEFEVFDTVAERAEAEYAELSGAHRSDKSLRLFWANMEVIRPSIYARPPVPVVAPRFSDRKPLHRETARVLERALQSFVAESDMHPALRLIRDDLAITGRGVGWVRLNEDGECEVEHIDRTDFLHDPARKWAEVRWVARRAWKPREWVEENFPKAKLKELPDDQRKPIKGDRKVPIWEIWHRAENAVVWVADEYDTVLRKDKPPLKLKGFFPCPEPAYGTVQPRSLLPVPDWHQYRDQLREIDIATKRIAALTDLIRLKGFYDSGAGDMGDAIRAVFEERRDDALLQGIPGLSQLMAGGGSLVEWFPSDKAAQTIQVLVQLRQQLISDVYEITGISDIMRGSSVASETATAQQIKAQYGSVRIRERQEGMTRIARDLISLTAEVLAEKTGEDDLFELAQIDDMPSDADIRKQIADLDRMAQQQLAQGMPDEAAVEQYQTQREALASTLTRDAVMGLLRDQRIRPFALTVETDSTIQPNEDSEKQRRTEFLTAFGGFMQQALPLVQAAPEAGGLVSAMLNFAAGGFRAGRELEQPIEDFTEQLESMASQPKGPSPEQQAEMQAREAEAQAKMAENAREDALAQADIAVKQADAGLKQAQAQKIAAEAQLAGITSQRAGEEWADQQFFEAMQTQATGEFNAAMQMMGAR